MLLPQQHAGTGAIRQKKPQPRTVGVLLLVGWGESNSARKRSYCAEYGMPHCSHTPKRTPTRARHSLIALPILPQVRQRAGLALGCPWPGTAATMEPAAFLAGFALCLARLPVAVPPCPAGDALRGFRRVGVIRAPAHARDACRVSHRTMYATLRSGAPASASARCIRCCRCRCQRPGSTGRARSAGSRHTSPAGAGSASRPCA